MSNKEEQPHTQGGEDELDDWDQRIYSTGCAKEQLQMNDCYYDRKDWRKCAREVSLVHPNKRVFLWRGVPDGHQMQAFKECWKRKGNEERTQTKDV